MSAESGTPWSDVSLSARALALESSQMTIEYTVVNHSPVSVYVFGLLYRTEQSGAIATDPNLVYSWVDEHAILWFSKMLLETPPWAMVESPEVPFLLRLDAGGTFSGQIRSPLPLHLYDPYDDNYPPDYQPFVREAKGWAVAIGYVRAEPGLPIEKMGTWLGRDLFVMPYDDCLRRQVVIHATAKPVMVRFLEPARRREREMIEQSR
jgi:hypothetical protein